MNFNDLDRYLNHLIKDCKLPYLDLAVSLDGKQIYRRGVGHTDAEGKKPVSGDILLAISTSGNSDNVKYPVYIMKKKIPVMIDFELVMVI